MRLLTLRGAYEGGLTCSEQSKEWPSLLKPALSGVSAISLLVQEEEGRLNISAADGHGHVVFARISVPYMPPPQSPPVKRLKPHEMPSEAVIRELSSTSIRPHYGSLFARTPIEDRIEVIPG